MSQKLAEELLEVAKWWNHHRRECTDVQKQLEFLINANDHLMWILGRVVQDLMTVEAGRKLQFDVNSLMLPMGIKFNGDFRAQA